MGMREELERQVVEQASAKRSRTGKGGGAWWGASVSVEHTDDGELLTVTYSPILPMVLTLGFFAMVVPALVLGAFVPGIKAVVVAFLFIAACSVLVYDIRWLWWRRWSVLATPEGHFGRRRGSGGVTLDQDMRILHGRHRVAGWKLGGVGLEKGGRNTDVTVYRYGFSPAQVATAKAFAERHHIKEGPPHVIVPYGR